MSDDRFLKTYFRNEARKYKKRKKEKAEGVMDIKK